VRTSATWVSLVVLLTSCQASPEPVETEQSIEIIESQPVVEEVAQDQAAELMPDADASANQAYFEQVLAGAGAGQLKVAGPDVIQALIDAGFPEDDIDITPDASLIALPADSVAVAIFWKEQCLIGQYTDQWLATDVAPPVADGSCLVHEVETLD